VPAPPPPRGGGVGGGGAAAAAGELAHRLGAGLRQVVQVQLAAEREEQAARVRRPLVVDDARQPGDALARLRRSTMQREVPDQRLSARRLETG
jgi:hypothetical protein